MFLDRVTEFRGIGPERNAAKCKQQRFQLHGVSGVIASLLSNQSNGAGLATLVIYIAVKWNLLHIDM